MYHLLKKTLKLCILDTERICADVFINVINLTGLCSGDVMSWGDIQLCQTQLGSFLSLITNQSNNTRENGKVP
jgi:hypothetical protein